MYGFIDEINPMSQDSGPGFRFFLKFTSGSSQNSKFMLTSEELLRKILKYRHYYQDGGVTFQVNDLSQLAFLQEMLKMCHMVNLNTALYIPIQYVNQDILKDVDLLILNMDNKINIESLFTIDTKIWLRYIVTDNRLNIGLLKKVINSLKNLEKIEFYLIK